WSVHRVLSSLARYRTRAARSPIEHALAPDVDESHEQNEKESDDLDQARPSQIAERDGPRVQKGHLDVEEQEDHGDQVELDRLPLAGIADGRHAAFVRRKLFGSGISRSEQDGEPNHDARKSDAERHHDDYAEPAVHYRFLPSRSTVTIRLTSAFPCTEVGSSPYSDSG